MAQEGMNESKAWEASLQLASKSWPGRAHSTAYGSLQSEMYHRCGEPTLLWVLTS